MTINQLNLISLQNILPLFYKLFTFKWQVLKTLSFLTIQLAYTLNM